MPKKNIPPRKGSSWPCFATSQGSARSSGAPWRTWRGWWSARY